MDRSIITLLLILVFTVESLAQSDLQLNPPQLNKSAAIIQPRTSLSIDMDFRMEGASIYYTLDGSEPDQNSTKYDGPIVIPQQCNLQARTYHPDYLPSDIITGTYLDAGIPYSNITISSSPNPKYVGDGTATLNDGILGDQDFTNSYLGFNQEPIEIKIEFPKRTKIKGIMISYLVNQGAWIFAPESVVIDKEKVNLRFDDDQQDSGKQFSFIELKKKRRKCITVRLTPNSEIPNWHSGAGNKGWLFLDEVLVY